MAVALNVYALKRYPTRLDYITVASQIIHEYPFLKSPVGDGHVSAVHQIDEYACLPLQLV